MVLIGHFSSISLHPTILCDDCLHVPLTSLIIPALFSLQVPLFLSIPYMQIYPNILYFVFFSLCCTHSPWEIRVISCTPCWWLIVIIFTKISLLHSKSAFSNLLDVLSPHPPHPTLNPLLLFHWHPECSSTPLFTPYVQLIVKPCQFFFLLYFSNSSPNSHQYFNCTSFGSLLLFPEILPKPIVISCLLLPSPIHSLPPEKSL